MKSKPLITVIGSCGQSIFMFVDRFHEKGETLRSNSMIIEPGGKGYNQAVGCARMGADTVYISVVGDDAYGKECIDFLKAENIDTSLFKIVEGEKTSLGVILTDSKGENRVTLSPGSEKRRLNPEDIKAAEDTIARSDILLINFEIPYDVFLAAVEIAYRNGVRIILNPAPAVDPGDDILKKIFFLTPNEYEAKTISGIKDTGSLADPVEYAKALNARGAKNLVITLGEKGALLYTDNKPYMASPYELNAVDTTGAGDTFNAALSVRIAKGDDYTEAVEYAVAASALSVTKKGVLNAIPTEQMVYDFMRAGKKVE